MLIITIVIDVIELMKHAVLMCRLIKCVYKKRLSFLSKVELKHLRSLF